MRKIVGLYLAAGKSSRMGCNKLSLPLGGATLGNRALRAACSSQLDEVLVLTKKHDTMDWVQQATFEAEIYRKCRQIQCPRASDGQSHTLRCGVQAAEIVSATAVVVMLADQPFVPVSMLNDLVTTYRCRERDDRETLCVAASYQGIPRPPVLFSYRLFSSLKLFQGDEGARRLLRGGDSVSTVIIEYSAPDFFRDIDTPAEYEAIQYDAGILKNLPFDPLR